MLFGIYDRHPLLFRLFSKLVKNMHLLEKQNQDLTMPYFPKSSSVFIAIALAPSESRR